ncbi:MAG: hypothetical protein BroJett011_04140 [Chloroflexota bacterium]|nr:MAG: hypothetical protein BroJett011_04140 [Chloroflexota bacterium]
MPTLTDLQAQYDRLQAAIAQTPPEHRAGLHYASGLLVSEIKAHPDYSLAYPFQGGCPICKGRGVYTGVNQETNHVGPLRCWCQLEDSAALQSATCPPDGGCSDAGAPAAEWQKLLCLCCDAPATHALGDWDVCETHYNSLAAPWPEEALWP